jgi:hypothetical protein
MALDKTNLIALAMAASKASPSAPVAYSYEGKDFSYAELNDTLYAEMSELAKDNRSYRENKNTIFSIIETVIDNVLPKRVQGLYESFAEIKNVAQGDKPLFRRKVNNRLRAKQFVTRVGLAGRYEVWKMAGGESFEVPTSAIGGAIQIGFEEFLDGRVDWAEMLNIILEGMDDLIAFEIEAALKAAVTELPANNVVATAGFDEAAFDKLVNIAKSYGDVTIYCFDEFATKMIPAEAWRYSDNMKEQVWTSGHLQGYKGNRVVILGNSVTDETNSEKALDPSYCWIIPNGGDSKPVKVVIEGDTCVKENESNDDWSRDLHIYKKVGVAALLANDVCSYRDTTLSKQIGSWNFKADITFPVVTETES